MIPAVLSALLLWAAYPPMGEACAIVFALTPLLVVSRLCSPRRSAGTWFLGGFLFWFATLSWMPAISKNNGPLPLVILGWIGLAALCSSYFALFGWLVARAWRREGKRDFGLWTLDFGLWSSAASASSPRPEFQIPKSQVPSPNSQVQSPRSSFSSSKLFLIVLVEPVLWAGLEWVRSWLFTGFAWNFLGTAVGATVPSLAAPARLGGVYLVSALVVLLNGVFATLVCRLLAQMCAEEGGALDAWEPVRGRRLARTLETALPLGLILLFFFVSNLGFSFSLGQSPKSEVQSPAIPVRVALVQRNAPCVFSKRDRSQDPLETFDRLLATASVAKQDLVVWAESAMSEFGHLDSDGARHAALYFARRTGGASLLAGGDWWYAAEGGRRVWNAAALYTPTATNVEIQVYGKQHLVPFGEYIPFDKWITPLQKLSPVGVSIWPGEAKVLELGLSGGRGRVKLAPLICFEDTDPVLARRAARLGAQAIVLITNDSWFAHSHETVQHAAQAALRAIETGLPVIRVGNSGVTGVISPSGRTRWLEDGEGRVLVDAAGTMVETVGVPSAPQLTPYSRFGDVPLMVVFALTLAGVLLAGRRAAKREIPE